MISTLHQQDVRVKLEIKSIVDTSDTVLKEFFLIDGTKVLNIVDFTNPRARKWYSDLMENLLVKYEFDSFQLNINFGFAYIKMQDNPTSYAKNYITTIANIANISSYFAYNVQDVPLMVHLDQFSYGKEGYLRLPIANALSV